jgi:SAM-dependent methyltransferase
VADAVWALGDAYDAYVGRWSALVAEVFLRRLDVPARRRWLDAGCGTGVLTSAVCDHADPARVIGADTSVGFLAGARTRVQAASFCAGDARALPFPDRAFDAVVSGLTLNFVPDPAQAVGEFARLTTPGGIVAAYVWDYADGMAMMRYFWDAATSLDPDVADRDQGRLFPICRPDPLAQAWTGAGLAGVAVEAIEVPTVFADFDDYWRPFLGGTGVAPSYVSTLTEGHRAALRDRLRAELPAQPDGSIPLTARAWAVRGSVRGSVR